MIMGIYILCNPIAVHLGILINPDFSCHFRMKWLKFCNPWNQGFRPEITQKNVEKFFQKNYAITYTY